MRTVCLSFLLATGALAQIQTINNEQMATARTKLNNNFSYLDTNKMRYRGTWSSGTTYAAQEVVQYSSITYIAIQSTNLNHQPDTSALWWTAVGGTATALTIASGKTLTVSNTLTFTATDSSSVAFGAGGTIGYPSGSITANAIGVGASASGYKTPCATCTLGSNAYMLLQGTVPAIDFSLTGAKFAGIYTDSAGIFGVYSEGGGLLEIGPTTTTLTAGGSFGSLEFQSGRVDLLGSGADGSTLYINVNNLINSKTSNVFYLFPNTISISPDGYPGGQIEIGTEPIALLSGRPHTDLTVYGSVDSSTKYMESSFHLSALNSNAGTVIGSLFSLNCVGKYRDDSTWDLTGFVTQCGMFDNANTHAVWNYLYSGQIFAFDSTVSVYVTGTLVPTRLSFADQCASVTSPATCGTKPAGASAIPTGGTTFIVNTSAVTANSQIDVQFDSSLGTLLGITCNTTIQPIVVTARTAGTSFTVTTSANPVTNKMCFTYTITN